MNVDEERGKDGSAGDQAANTAQHMSMAELSHRIVDVGLATDAHEVHGTANDQFVPKTGEGMRTDTGVTLVGHDEGEGKTKEDEDLS